ncbi:hypothetical protein GUITHDRAFT_145967 [Guillardia theta CCMP2712]|uniref:Uncharacterized protein n=1 Tax=Guillardia theta (strain CCMP2712) TaxID=905079 RepID=L1IK19_GUITC|nr:hypothetical protein GUITHDRAFT_145967 [Guillardia theta CCMP2712]EKX36150.1 hypothetical protein GUITHDRAFT_145967 [Guillardia theta CCMP2712]|eukprot:XP_005823130.1 hypothetical protein GUITHDRAFT_145967 [Guillardia theta CCMP2712]
MIKTAIFWAVIGIAAYIWMVDMVERFSESKDKSIFNIVDVIKETNKFVQNGWVARIIKRPMHYLFCHVQIMETLELYTYTIYWLVHKTVITSVMFARGWSHLATVQTGVIFCMIVFFTVCLPFDMEFDITHIDINLRMTRYIAFEIILNFALIFGTQFLPEYECNSFLSINIYNYIFFSNLGNTMILLCLHCLVMILFDLYVNGYGVKIASMKQTQILLDQLHGNIKRNNASLAAFSSLGDIPDDVHESIKHLTAYIQSEKQKLDVVQQSLDEIIIHVQFTLVMIHLATMFYLLSTYFTQPNNHNQKQVQQQQEEEQQQEVQQEQEVQITFISTLVHMALFVATILISPRAQRPYLILMSVVTTVIKPYLQETIPPSHGKVCHMNPKYIDIFKTKQGGSAVRILYGIQIIVAVYLYWIF